MPDNDNAPITTPGLEPGVTDREHFISLWHEFAEVNLIHIIPARLKYDGALIMGAIAPIVLQYASPEPDRPYYYVPIDILYGYSDQQKNETMRALRHHAGVTKDQTAPLVATWGEFRAPVMPQLPDPDPNAPDSVIGPAVTEDQVPITYPADQRRGWFNRKGAAMSWPPNTSIVHNGVTYTLRSAPWPTLALFGGVPLFWQRRA